MKLCSHDKAVKSLYYVKVALVSKTVYQTAEGQCKISVIQMFKLFLRLKLVMYLCAVMIIIDKDNDR